MNNDQLATIPAPPDSVPPGYKRTEVGVIPEDWEIRPLSDLCPPQDLVRGPFGGALKKDMFVEAGYKVYEQRNAIYKSCNIGSYFVSPSKFSEMHRFSVAPGDFIVSCSGTIVRIYQIPRDAPPGIINQALLKIRTNNRIVFDQFFYLVFEWDKFQARIIDSTQGGAMQNLVGMVEFKNTPVILPPLPEQRAIAAALGDADALITSLDALISKKRAVKQATMQQLLTGTTRLPGFSGEWEVKRLEELGHFLKGSGVTRDSAQSGSLACVRYGEIYTTHNDYIRAFHSWISAEVAASATRLQRGDLLFAGSGETKEEIGKCVAFVDDREAYAGGDIVLLRPRGANSLFLGYALNTSEVNKQKASRGQGDAVVHISATALAQISLPLPQPEEQTAIAAVLASMDAEIAALEAQRSKTQQIKQGMMQQLLTGKIRLG